MEWNIVSGQLLIDTYSTCPKDIVQPKCDELYRVCEVFTDRLAKRLETLLKARDLMERVEKVRKIDEGGSEFEVI